MCGSLNILWHGPTLLKLTICNPLTTAEFSQFAGILSAALSQHHLSGFEIAQLHSVQFSRLVVSDSLRPHESQHTRPPCPSPTPGVNSDSRPLSQWCHPAISSSVVPFSSCPQSLPASESFPMSQPFPWDSQSIGVSALASVHPKYTRADLLQNGLVASPCSPRALSSSYISNILRWVQRESWGKCHSKCLHQKH